MALLRPDWELPASVSAYVTTRHGGVSSPPYDTFNLGDHVGDAPKAVAENRRLLQNEIGRDISIQWLSQVHGVDVISAQGDDVKRQADGSFSDQQNIACAVLTADCLPVLLCNKQGSEVAAVHCGWRSLVGGILEQTIQQLQSKPQDIMAWFGPAIGPRCFEVGEDVRSEFLAKALKQGINETENSFVAHEEMSGKYLADLCALARLRLQSQGVVDVSGGTHCTVTENNDWYSYRKEGDCGRMLSMIWISR